MKRLLWGLEVFIVITVGALSGAPRLAAQSLVLGLPLMDTNSVVLNWSGGAGPYLVQRKNNLTDPNWLDVSTTTQSYAVIPTDSGSAFYQLQDGITNTDTNTIKAYSASLTGAAERPTPLANSATGFATVFRNRTNITWSISYSGLSSSVGAVYLEGPANTSNTGPIILRIAVLSSNPGTITGQSTLSGSQTASLAFGQVYLNIETPANPAGEIRGQITPVMYNASLNGTNESPVVVTAGSGTGTFNVVGNQLWYDITYSNLSSDATVAELTQGTNVLQTLSIPGGTNGGTSGKLTLPTPQLDSLINLSNYLNICTVSNTAGEVRGIITPSSTTMGGVGGA